jgi:hypothetical protein
LLRFLVLASVPLAVAVLVVLGRGGAAGDELLEDGGFESGVDGWLPLHEDVSLSLSPTAHSGSQALEVSGVGEGGQAYRDIAIIPGEAYQLSGWLRIADANVALVFFRLHWLGASGTFDTAWVVSFGAYEEVTTGILTAPPDATHARIVMQVFVDTIAEGFTVLADDLSFDGAKPTPSPPSTPTLSASPSPSDG